MYSFDGEPLKVLGLDPHDPASVVAWRKFLLDWDADLAALAAAVAADQVRAKLAEMASVLDARDGTAEHAMHVQSVAAVGALIEQIGLSAAEGALSDAGIAVREFPGFVDALGEGKLSEEQLRVLTGAGLPVTAAENGMCMLRARLPLVEGAAIADRLRKQSKALIKARPKPTVISTAGAKSPGTSGTSAAEIITAGRTADTATGADTAGTGTAGTTAAARAATEAPDERTIDEVKADLFADMLLTSDPMACAAAAGIQASVHLTIPILTALTALSGGPSSRWPGCRQPAARCDLDYTHAWEHGGTTTLENLCGLCKHHHVMKHATAWSVEQLSDGVLEWRTQAARSTSTAPNTMTSTSGAATLCRQGRRCSKTQLRPKPPVTHRRSEACSETVRRSKRHTRTRRTTATHAPAPARTHGSPLTAHRSRKPHIFTNCKPRGAMRRSPWMGAPLRVRGFPSRHR